MDEASGKAPRRKIPPAPRSLYTLLYLASLAVLGAAAFASVYNEIPIGTLTRDPIDILQGHPLYGALSNLGVLLWCGAAAVCLYTVALLRGRLDARTRRFLVLSGVLTLVLLGDNLFQVHEDLVDRLFDIDESIGFFLATYGVLFVLYLAVCRRAILETDWSLLALAIVFFAVSQLLDSFHIDIGRWTLLLEDGTKFLGIVSWFGYYVRTSYHHGRVGIRVGATARGT